MNELQSTQRTFYTQHQWSGTLHFTLKCLLYVSHLSNMCMPRTDTEFLYLNASPRTNLNHGTFFYKRGPPKPVQRISWIQSAVWHFYKAEEACWGKLPTTLGRKVQYSEPLTPSLPVSPTHARPCNSPITQWRMSRCCEILFLKMYLFEFIVM